MRSTPPDSLHMWSKVGEISLKNSWWVQGFSFGFVLTGGWKTWVWGTKTRVFWEQVFLYFKNTPCTCWHGLTSKRERAERVGGRGEEEALEEAAASSDERRTLWCLRRWSNRALHTLCSSSILGPAGTLHKHRQKAATHVTEYSTSTDRHHGSICWQERVKASLSGDTSRIRTKTLGKINFPLTEECFGTWWHDSSSHVYLAIAVCF